VWWQLGLAVVGLIGFALANRGRSDGGSAPEPSAVERPAASAALPAQAALPTQAGVKRAIDGDSIELVDGQRVRYIGIDTPEMRRRNGRQWVKDPEPYAVEATAANRLLVEGKTIRLEYDVQTHDKYGRLLAYVYVEDRMINDVLLESGYATPMTVPPNVKYADRFRELSQQARQEQRGLWADAPPAASNRKGP
jgi:micrococcal nuclease